MLTRVCELVDDADNSQPRYLRQAGAAVAAVALVCARLRHPAQRALFRRVHVEDTAKARSLAATLCARPDLATVVKRVARRDAHQGSRSTSEWQRDQTAARLALRSIMAACPKLIDYWSAVGSLEDASAGNIPPLVLPRCVERVRVWETDPDHLATLTVFAAPTWLDISGHEVVWKIRRTQIADVERAVHRVAHLFIRGGEEPFGMPANEGDDRNSEYMAKYYGLDDYAEPDDQLSGPAYARVLVTGAAATLQHVRETSIIAR